MAATRGLGHTDLQDSVLAQLLARIIASGQPGPEAQKVGMRDRVLLSALGSYRPGKAIRVV